MNSNPYHLAKEANMGMHLRDVSLNKQNSENIQHSIIVMIHPKSPQIRITAKTLVSELILYISCFKCWVIRTEHTF